MFLTSFSPPLAAIDWLAVADSSRLLLHCLDSLLACIPSTDVHLVYLMVVNVLSSLRRSLSPFLYLFVVVASPCLCVCISSIKDEVCGLMAFASLGHASIRWFGVGWSSAKVTSSAASFIRMSLSLFLSLFVLVLCLQHPDCFPRLFPVSCSAQSDHLDLKTFRTHLLKFTNQSCDGKTSKSSYGSLQSSVVNSRGLGS